MQHCVLISNLPSQTAHPLYNLTAVLLLLPPHSVFYPTTKYYVSGILHGQAHPRPHADVGGVHAHMRA